MEISKYNKITDALINNALFWPNKKAYIFLLDGENKKQELTFQELYNKVVNFSKFLDDRCEKNDRVLLCYPPGLEYITAFYACLSKGLIAVPIYPPDTRNNGRIKCIIEDSGAKLALTTVDFYEKSDYGLNYNGLSWTSTNFVNEETDNTDKLIDEAEPEDIAFLQYTSGSTSDPKGVMVSNKNLIANSYLIKKSFQHDENCIMVSWLPPYHDMGLIGSIVQPMFAGMTGVLMSPSSFIKRPIRWIKAISEYGKLGPITSGGPNFSYDICCNYIGEDRLQDIDISNWRVAFNGAEPIRSETLKNFSKKFSNCGFSYKCFYPVYGLAESTLLASAGDIYIEPILKKIKIEALKSNKFEEDFNSDKKNYTELTGCGENLEGQTIYIVNLETLKKCEDGEIGEIWVKGPSIAVGYWYKETATIKTFRAYTSDTSEGPFLRTGDLGFFYNKELFVTGRSKELIIIRGQNFYPQDIEKVVEQSSECLRPGCGAAFSVDLDGEEKLIIVYELQRKYLQNFDMDKLTSFIKKAISESFDLTVHNIVFIETSSFPKTSSGKLQRILVKQMYNKNELSLINQLLECN
jgi:acyl-CoA synthetase (AMP-forming)/AMP-acid ligase II